MKRAIPKISGFAIAALIKAAIDLASAQSARAQDAGTALHAGAAGLHWTPEKGHQFFWTGKTGAKKISYGGSLTYIPIVSGKIAGHILITGEKGVKPGLSAGISGKAGRIKGGLTLFDLNKNSIVVSPGVIINFGKGISVAGSQRLAQGEKPLAGIEFSPELRKKIFGKLSPEQISVGIKSAIKSHPEWTAGIEVKKNKTSYGIAVTPKSRTWGFQVRKGLGKDLGLYIGGKIGIEKGSKPKYYIEGHFPFNAKKFLHRKTIPRR